MILALQDEPWSAFCTPNFLGNKSAFSYKLLSVFNLVSTMGYIAQWDEFSVSAERLFLSAPLRVGSDITNSLMRSTF